MSDSWARAAPALIWWTRTSLWVRWPSSLTLARTAAMTTMVRATRLSNGSWLACWACSASSCACPCAMGAPARERGCGTGRGRPGARARAVGVPGGMVGTGPPRSIGRRRAQDRVAAGVGGGQQAVLELGQVLAQAVDAFEGVLGLLAGFGGLVGDGGQAPLEV